jgi:hypothetical protein
MENGRDFRREYHLIDKAYYTLIADVERKGHFVGGRWVPEEDPLDEREKKISSLVNKLKILSDLRKANPNADDKEIYKLWKNKFNINQK